MADGMEPFFAVRRHEFHFGIVIQYIAQVFVFPIHFGQESGLPQFLVQALGNGQQGAAGFEFFHAAIRQAYFNVGHIDFLLENTSKVRTDIQKRPVPHRDGP